MSPFKANFGYNMTLTPTSKTRGRDTPLHLALLKKLHEWCSLWISQAQGRQKKAYDKKKKSDETPLKEGDCVWISSWDLSTNRPSPKLEALWFRPYAIKEVMGPLTYKVHTPEHWRVNRVFHQSKLTLVEPAVTGQPSHVTNPTTIEQTPYISTGLNQDEQPDPSPTTCPHCNARR